MSAPLTLAVGYAVPRAGVPSSASFRRWVEAALQGARRRKPTELAIRLVDADEGRALNRDYRGKDYATNVLSFPYEIEPVVVGDLVICTPVVAREAAEQGKTPEAHYAHLTVHGLLHLQGYDHETGEDDAQRMEDKERAILASLGFDDPYQDRKE